eukprot:Awhi_evm1s7842
MAAAVVPANGTIASLLNNTLSEKPNRTYGIYVVPCESRSQNNPFYSEISSLYKRCEEESIFQKANFLTWGGMFHLTLSGFVEPTSEEGEIKFLQSVKEIMAKSKLYNSKLFKNAVKISGGSKYYQIDVESDCLKTIAHQLRSVDVYKNYPRDKIRGSGVKFHFTLANSRSEAGMQRLKEIIFGFSPEYLAKFLSLSKCFFKFGSQEFFNEKKVFIRKALQSAERKNKVFPAVVEQHRCSKEIEKTKPLNTSHTTVSPFPLLRDAFRRKDKIWHEAFQNLNWRLVVVSYEQGANCLTRRATFQVHDDLSY